MNGEREHDVGTEHLCVDVMSLHQCLYVYVCLWPIFSHRTYGGSVHLFIGLWAMNKPMPVPQGQTNVISTQL